MLTKWQWQIALYHFLSFWYFFPGCNVAYIGIKPSKVVENFYVLENSCRYMDSRRKELAIYYLGFQRSEESLDYWLSRPGEFHPQPLAEPDLSRSTHPAPIVQPSIITPSRQCAKITGSLCQQVSDPSSMSSESLVFSSPPFNEIIVTIYSPPCGSFLLFSTC